MNLATFWMDGPRIGVADDGHLWDLRRVVTGWLFEVERNVHAADIAASLVPFDMTLFIRQNHGGLDQFREAIAWAREHRDAFERPLGALPPLVVPIDRVRLLTYARRSVSETHSVIRRLQRFGVVTADEVRISYSYADRISAMLWNLIRAQ